MIINFIKSAFENIFKNRLMSFATLVTITSTLMIIGIYYSMYTNIDYNIGYFQEMNGIEVFLDTELSETEIEDFGVKFSEMDIIEDVEYVSKQDAINKMFSNDLEEDYYTDDLFLPASYKLKVTDDKYKSKLVSELEDVDGIIEITYDTVLGSVLKEIRAGISYGSILFISILAFIAVVLIMNTIKLSIHIRKYEIGVTKNLGATDWFIKLPFIFEGMILGGAGSILAYGITNVIYNNTLSSLLKTGFVSNELIGNTPFVIRNFADVSTNILLLCLGVGIGLGIIVSNYTSNKYLKV
ncbi:MAG: permease-like cell division protein FtsX [Clostridia bacterium]|nr:permease-like cell division protein FtsX [Clostridia bacterium]